MNKENMIYEEQKKLDFSIMNKASSIYMIFRSVAVFLLFIYPYSYLYTLIIYAFTWILDSLDDNVIEKTGNIKLTFKPEDAAKLRVYNIFDKISDFFVTVFFVIWAVLFLPEYQFIIIILTLLRLVGILIYFKILNDQLLLFFPNIIHFLLGILLLMKVFIPDLYFLSIYDFRYYLNVIALSIIIGMLSEVITHVWKPEIMEKY